MKYTVTPGCIAACQYIEPEGGERYCAIYMGVERLDPTEGAIFEVAYDVPTPDKVKAIVNRNFGMLFSIPVERRERTIVMMQPETIEV